MCERIECVLAPTGACANAALAPPPRKWKQLGRLRSLVLSNGNTWMLKITRVAESNEQIILHLDGSVTGPWIQLLRTSAEAVLDQGLQLVIDLEHICFIDCEGLALIKSLISRGGRQVNAPLFVADQLRKCEGERND